MTKDTMHPEKPEDCEAAIPWDREFLKQELERMLGCKLPDKIMEPTISTTPAVAIVKCTCPIKLHTKKRDKKKGLIVMKKQNNGYYPFCPVHTKL